MSKLPPKWSVVRDEVGEFEFAVLDPTGFRVGWYNDKEDASSCAWRLHGTTRAAHESHEAALREAAIAVMVLRDIIDVCTKGPKCLVCGEVFDEVHDGPVEFPKCEIYTASLWLDNHYSGVEPTYEMSSEDIERRLVAMREHFGFSDEEFVKKWTDGSLTGEPDYVEWLVLLGRSDLV